MPIADEKVRRQKRRREDADGVNDQSKRISTAEEEGRDHQKQIKLEYEEKTPEKSKPAPGCSFWGNQEEKALKIKKADRPKAKHLAFNQSFIEGVTLFANNKEWQGQSIQCIIT